jgi:hypothetical protein
MEKKQLKCKQCNWQGSEDELEYDIVETCMGNDKIEICPQCSSMEVIFAYSPDRTNEATKAPD